MMVLWLGTGKMSCRPAMVALFVYDEPSFLQPHVVGEGDVQAVRHGRDVYASVDKLVYEGEVVICAC